MVNGTLKGSPAETAALVELIALNVCFDLARADGARDPGDLFEHLRRLTAPFSASLVTSCPMQATSIDFDQLDHIERCFQAITAAAQ